MTGAPEAALARELRQCYSAIALVTDMDAGAESGQGVGQEEVFALFKANLERLTGLLAATIAALPDPDGCTCSHLGRRPRAHLRRPRAGRVKVLLTGSAGFIGTAIGDRLEAAGDEVVRVDLMLEQAHGATDAARRHPPARRARRRDLVGLGRPAARRRRGLPPGRRRRRRGQGRPTCPAYAGHNDLGTAALLAAMHEAGVDRLVLASSMVVYGEGRYTCPEHGDQVPGPRAVAALDAGDFDNHCPLCGAPLGWALVDEDARLDPRSCYAASKLAQEHYTSLVGAPGRRLGGRAALPQRLRPRDAARHAVLRGRGDVPLLPGAGGAAAGLRGRRPDA